MLSSMGLQFEQLSVGSLNIVRFVIKPAEVTECHIFEDVLVFTIYEPWQLINKILFFFGEYESCSCSFKHKHM
jgi:hypothetical protein